MFIVQSLKESCCCALKLWLRVRLKSSKPLKTGVTFSNTPSPVYDSPLTIFGHIYGKFTGFQKIGPYKVRTANGKGGWVFQHGTPVLSITKAQLAKHRCAKTDENLSFLITRGILRGSVKKQGSFKETCLA